MSAPSFVDWSTALLQRQGITPSLAQRTLYSVACDGVDPASLPAAQRALAAEMFGPDVQVVPPAARRVLVIISGRGVGKTLYEGLYLLYRALCAPLRGVALGERVFFPFLSIDRATARQGVNFARGVVEAVPSYRALLQAESKEQRRGRNAADGFVLRRPDKREVAIEVLTAARAGVGARGRTLGGIALDEYGFHHGEDASVSDIEILRGVTPRLLPTAQVAIISSPWAEGSHLHTLFRENWNKPTSALVAKAPAILLRPELAPMRALETDPIVLAREWDAEFVSANSQRFVPEDLIERALAAPELDVEAAA
jgi:hypothetical protein